MGPCLHLRFSQKLGFCPNLPDPQNVQSKKTSITFAFYAIYHFYVNVQNFWGGGRIVGPQPLLDTRYYHHHPSPPHHTHPTRDWDNIQTFPQNIKRRAPLREGYKKFALLQCIFSANLQILNALILHLARL